MDDILNSKEYKEEKNETVYEDENSDFDSPFDGLDN
jgi:hypothetical protein